MLSAAGRTGNTTEVTGFMEGNSPTNSSLILRSATERERVSKDGNMRALRPGPSFETPHFVRLLRMRA